MSQETLRIPCDPHNNGRQGNSYLTLYIFTNPSARARYDTKSLFKTSCPTKAEELSLPYYLLIAGGRIIGFIPFSRILVPCEMQSVSSRIWTRIVVSISCDDNHYTTSIVIYEMLLFLGCNPSNCWETSCPTKAEELSLPYYLLIAGGRIIGFIPFSRILVPCEMQSVSSRIWTRIVVSISCDDNHYTTSIVIYEMLLFLGCNPSNCWETTLKSVDLSGNPAFLLTWP